MPLGANWDRTVPGDKCGHMRGLFISIGTINLVLDVGVIILPMPVLWNLQLAVRKKLGLTAIFGIGAMYASI